MRRINNMISWIFVGLSVLFAAQSVYAAEGDQFYFLAKRALSDSMTGQGNSVVYLRWDVVEGKLPDDVEHFVLKRNGVVLAEFPAHGTMVPEAIAVLYAGNDQARRKTETIAWLNKESRENDSGSGVDASNFAQVIYEHLHDANAPMWGMLASRIDFNIARARYRGFVDSDADTAHAYNYELLAENNRTGTPQYVRIGEVTVGAGAGQPLPKVEDFEQVRGVGRCDAPERFKEHGTLYLNWSNPGNNRVERYGNALLNAGYDLYCTTTDTRPSYTVDIAALAAGGNFDDDGDPSLPSELQKLNERPVFISAKAETEARYRGWNPPFSQYMLLPEALKKLGMPPGAHRYCYVVSRDFTGNYGATSDELNVTVPDMTPPPAPWNIWTAKYTYDNTFRLAWLNTDVANYYAEHKRGRKYCNLPTARLDKRLNWVDLKGSCETNASRSVALDPSEYLIYRFESVEAAQRFKDSDGDGYSDMNESTGITGHALLSLPGTACKYNAAGALPYPNYLVARIAAIPQRRLGAKAVVEFTDTVVPQHKGKFFWYRIATRDADGQISDLSQPVRGFFPKRNLPQRPGNLIGKEHCFFGASVEETSQMGGQPPHPLFQDLTGKAAYGVIGCVGDPDTSLLSKKISWHVLPLLEHSAYVNRSECEQLGDINTRCSSEVQARFYASDGTMLASEDFSRLDCTTTTDVESGTETSEPSHTATLNSECGGPLEPFDDGEVTDDPIYLNPSGMNDCIKVGYRVNGVYYLEGTHCPPFASPLQLEVPHFGGGEVCVEYETQNDNAESSSRYRGPCVIRPFKMKVFAPQAVSIVPSATNASATLVWAPPKQPLVGTMVEWYRKGGAQYHSALVAFENNLSADGTQTYTAAVTPPPTGTQWQEEWCFRARTLGKTGGAPEDTYSEWSDEVCAIRQPDAATLPQYIPWPKAALPVNEGNYSAEYYVTDGIPGIVLTDNIDVEAECGHPDMPNCLTGPCFTEQPIQGDCQFCKLLRDALGNTFSFVVYRQESSDGTDANAGSFYQVSPKIDRLFCPDASSVQDPFVTLIHNYLRINDQTTINEYKMVVKDLFPHEVGKFYRYQIVHFDQKGEISGYRQTGWIKAVTP